MKLRDLVGQRFGRLVVLERSQNKISGKQTKTAWKCLCDCGNFTIVNSQELLRGCTKSCGCLAKEAKKNNTKTHGMSNTRLYKIWLDMKARCYNNNENNYCNYGGRGIVVCEEWLVSFENFLSWAVNNGYSDELSIDRIDVNGNYEPSNCRWATRLEQANNTRNNFMIEYKGEKHSVSEWARRCNIKSATIRARIVRWHWDVEKALTTPVRGNK